MHKEVWIIAGSEVNVKFDKEGTCTIDLDIPVTVKNTQFKQFANKLSSLIEQFMV